MNRFQCLESIEIPKESLVIVKELGEGQFGKVFEGNLRLNPEGGIKKVAIKLLSKVEHSAQDHFFLEAMTMRKFSHPHIIKLIGIISRADPICLVMEIAHYGELRGFLKQYQMKLRLDNLLLYCYQISNALNYLSSKQVVHRDIAARNCLVFSFSIVKLADFGLSRLLQEHNYYRAVSKGKMPIKWMAPESIFYRRFTTYSDVWMFGVCCWEIFMFGVKPFPGMKNQYVVEVIEKGHKLERPNTCPRNVYNLLEQCWAIRDTDRPSFEVLKEKFKQFFEEVSGKDAERVNEGENPDTTIPEKDILLAETESNALKEHLERSIQQSVDDSVWLLKQEKKLPYKVATSPTRETQPPITSSRKKLSSVSSPRIESIDSGLFQSFSNRSSTESTGAAGPSIFRTDLEAVGIDILQMILSISENVNPSSKFLPNSAAQNFVFEIHSKVIQFIGIVNNKKHDVTNLNSQTVMSMCCRVLENDAQEVLRGFRLSQQFSSHRELLTACNIMSIDIKNAINRICSLATAS